MLLRIKNLGLIPLLKKRRRVDESDRLEALHSMEVLGTHPERFFDELTALASAACDTSVAAITLVDRSQIWLKSAVGLGASGYYSRELSFCNRVIGNETPLTVSDILKSQRFRSLARAAGVSGMRFYTGVALVESAGHAVGTLCVLDRRPRVLNAAQMNCLEAVAQQVVTLLEVRKHIVRSFKNPHSAVDSSALQLLKHRQRTGLEHLVRACAVIPGVKDPLEAVTHSVAEIQDLQLYTPERPHRQESLRRCMEEAVEQFRRTASYSSVPILVTIPAQDIELECDRDRLCTLFVELLKNAADASIEGPERWVRFEAIDLHDLVGFRVLDSGRGIPKESAHRIFQPFYSTKKSHLGLGLSIAQSVAAEHGGTLSFNPSSANTCFLLQLPKMHGLHTR